MSNVVDGHSFTMIISHPVWALLTYLCRVAVVYASNEVEMIEMLCHHSCIYLEHQWTNAMSDYEVEVIVFYPWWDKNG